MKSWMRMMVWMGLAAALILWVVGQQGYRRSIVQAGDLRLAVSTDSSSVCLMLFPTDVAQEWFDLTRQITLMEIEHERVSNISIHSGAIWKFEEPDAQFAGQAAGLEVGAANRPTFIHAHHCLLCLTFLIATIATSVSWRNRPVESEQERADE